MATCYGEIGKHLEKDSDPQETDVAMQDEYQADINDLENIEPDHQAGLRDLTCKIEQLWQIAEANDNDPLDALSHLECKLNQLALTLCPPTPLELTSNKLWDEIKDSLHLKICNLDIRTSVSHFIEIQQKEKESLAAYIHQFKRKLADGNSIMMQ